MENTKERMMRAEIEIIDDMLRLYGHTAEEGLTWKLSRFDLMQMIYIVYESMSLRDDDDIPRTFRHLVSHYCNILHETIPRNPSSFVARSRNCRGERRQVLLLRYHKGQAYEASAF